MNIHISPFVVFALVSFAFAGNGTEQTQPSSAPDLIATIVTECEFVEAFRIAPKTDPNYKRLLRRGEWIAGYPVIQQAGRSRQRESARALGFAVLSANSSSKRCSFEPGYAIRYWRDNRSVSLLVCFKCGEVKVVPPGGSGQPTGLADFGVAYRAMLKFLRAEFPDDLKLRALETQE